MIKILFVCLGNICRSPTAEAVFRKVVQDATQLDKFEIDSAGTAGYHVGERPDSRAQAAALARGVDMSAIRARCVSDGDFEYYDLILAMDKNNLRDLKRRCPESYQDKIKLFLEFASGYVEREVPDPYYGGDEGFSHVLDLVENASHGLLASFTKENSR